MTLRGFTAAMAEKSLRKRGWRDVANRMYFANGGGIITLDCGHSFWPVCDQLTFQLVCRRTAFFCEDCQTTTRRTLVDRIGFWIWIFACLLCGYLTAEFIKNISI